MHEDDKRRYTKLDESQWARIEAEYSFGDVTIDELASRYGVSKRAIQYRFSDKGIEKGSAPTALAAAVTERIQSSILSDADSLAARAKQAREDTYSAADLIERLTVAQLQAAQADPAAAAKMGSVFKALSLAAATLERTGGIKRQALGLKEDDVFGRELPRLILADITDEEILVAQRGDANPDDDEIVADLRDDCV